MPRYTEISRVAMQVSRDVVVASIQVDLDDDVLGRLQEDLLGLVYQTAPRAAILDVSGVETLDSDEFAALRRIIAMVSIMGTESVLVGLQPGVVSALIEMGAEVEGLQTAIDLDAAFALLEPAPEAEPELDGEAGATAMEIEAGEDFPTLEPERIFEHEQ